MGVVYKARQISLNRPVALKMIRSAALASEDELRRFRNEAEAVARLDHPNIVPVYDVGLTDDGLCYVVSKYIEGSDLKERMQDARLSCRDSAGLVATVAEVLHHAHTRDLVHLGVIVPIIWVEPVFPIPLWPPTREDHHAWPQARAGRTDRGTT